MKVDFKLEPDSSTVALIDCDLFAPNEHSVLDETTVSRIPLIRGSTYALLMELAGGLLLTLIWLFARVTWHLFGL